MVHHNDAQLNQLFDTLSEWESQLQGENFDFEGPEL